MPPPLDCGSNSTRNRTPSVPHSTLTVHSGRPPVHLYYEFSTAISLALDSIRAHKLRSFLTLLGVIIGVASVVLVGAAIDGLGVYAEGITSKAFGSDSYLVAQLASVGRLTRKQLVEKQKR